MRAVVVWACAACASRCCLSFALIKQEAATAGAAFAWAGNALRTRSARRPWPRITQRHREGSKGSCSRPSRDGGCLQMRQDMLGVMQRKRAEVKRLLEDHSNSLDPLQMRLKYGADSSSFRLRDALRRNKDPDEVHKLAVVAELKRRSPTAAKLPEDIAPYPDMAEAAMQARSAGADVIMVATDGPAYGGQIQDLVETVRALDGGKRGSGPPVVMKDIILHPIQIALAAESGAAGVLLIAGVVGPRLEDLLNSATIMGIEAVVEVHTPAELRKTMEYGPNVVLVNNWDRISGTLHPKQALGMKSMLLNEMLSIAAGGIASAGDAAALADEGYDAVVLGRALARDPDPAALIRAIRNREGLQRRFLGMGLSAEEV